MGGISNYYPFGALMPGRSTLQTSEDLNQYGEKPYRYGFNGKEGDFSMKNSTGTSYDFGARMYDSRLGKFMSTDPWEDKYAWQTPYAYYSNTPIWKIDWKGLGDNKEGGKPATQDKHGNLTLAKDNNTQIPMNIKQFEEVKEKGYVSSSDYVMNVFTADGNVEFNLALGVEFKGASAGVNTNGELSVGGQNMTVSASEDAKGWGIPLVEYSKETKTVTKIVTASVVDPSTGKSRKTTFPMTVSEKKESLTIGINKAEIKTQSQNGQTVNKTSRTGYSFTLSKGIKKTPFEISGGVDLMSDPKPVKN